MRSHGLMLLLVCLLTVESNVAHAQTAVLRGFVTNAASGEALQGVNVILRDSTGAGPGTATDGDGFYAISRIAPGTYQVRATHVGFVAYTDTLHFEDGDVQALNFAMQPTETVLDDVLVESDGGTAVSLGEGVQTIRPQDIARIPTPGVAGDLAGYLTTLPGIVTAGDQGGQFFIRGGEPSQNLVLLDGMQVYQPFHVLGFYSVFPTDILRQVDIYPGAFGARYGGRLSSVIDVHTRNGNKQRYQGFGSASPFIVSAQAEGPIRFSWLPVLNERISFLASMRHAVVEDVAAPLINETIPYGFGDVLGKVHVIPSRNRRLSVTGLYTYDRGTVGQAEPGAPGELQPVPRDEVRWNNLALGARYLFLPGSLPILLDVSVSASRLESEFGDRDDPAQASTVGQLNTEVNVTQFGWVDIDWGLFARTVETSSDLGGLFQNVERRTEFVTEAGIYAVPTFPVGRHWRIVPGLRIHTFPSKDDVFVEPRLRVYWERGRQQASFAAGVYHQEIIGVNDRRDAASVFTAWRAIPFGGVPRATHAMLGYQIRLSQQVSLGAEGYHKDIKNHFVPEWTAFPRLTTRLQQASGQVWGLDARLEWTHPRFYGFASYGLTSVEYTATQPSLELWFDSPTFDYRPPHDRRHQVNLVGTTTVRGVELSARWQFGSGFPYNRALGFDGFVLMDDSVDVFTERGDRRVIYDRPFAGILPTYHRLDLSASRTFSLPGASVTAQGTLINAYDRANIFYLDVFTLRRVDQLPLLPSLGIKVAFE